MPVDSWTCFLAIREVDHSFQGVAWAARLAEAELSETVALVLDQVLLSMQLKVSGEFSVVSIKHIETAYVLSTEELPFTTELV